MVTSNKQNTDSGGGGGFSQIDFIGMFSGPNEKNYRTFLKKISCSVRPV